MANMKASSSKKLKKKPRRLRMSTKKIMQQLPLKLMKLMKTPMKRKTSMKKLKKLTSMKKLRKLKKGLIPHVLKNMFRQS